MVQTLVGSGVVDIDIALVAGTTILAFLPGCAINGGLVLPLLPLPLQTVLLHICRRCSGSQGTSMTKFFRVEPANSIV
jgi:hypothetical protein